MRGESDGACEGRSLGKRGGFVSGGPSGVRLLWRRRETPSVVSARSSLAGGEALLRAWMAQTQLPALLAVLSTLVQRGMTELSEWGADPESYVCEWQLPPLDESAADDDESCGADADGEVSSGQSRVQRLKHAAERVFGVLLQLAPAEVSPRMYPPLCFVTLPAARSHLSRCHLRQQSSRRLRPLAARPARDCCVHCSLTRACVASLPPHSRHTPATSHTPVTLLPPSCHPPATPATLPPRFSCGTLPMVGEALRR